MLLKDFRGRHDRFGAASSLGKVMTIGPRPDQEQPRSRIIKTNGMGLYLALIVQTDTIIG